MQPNKTAISYLSKMDVSKDNANDSTSQKNKSMTKIKFVDRLYQNPNKLKIEKSIEDEILDKEISSEEKLRLKKVFEKLCGEIFEGDFDNLRKLAAEVEAEEKKERKKKNESKSQKKPEEDKKNLKKSEEEKIKKIEDEKKKSKMCFGPEDIARILKKLNYHMGKQEIDMMIWEVDEDLDGKVNFREFELMYKRCIIDKIGLEPRRLFNLVEFLMFDKHDRGFITEEDTLTLLYVKTMESGKKYEEEIAAIFGKVDNFMDGEEKQVEFQEYLEKVNKRALDERRDRELEKKKLTTFYKERDDEEIKDK